MTRDIVIKQYGDKRTIWLNEGYLVRMCGVSTGYLRVARVKYKNNLPLDSRGLDILPDCTKSWRWARLNGRF